MHRLMALYNTPADPAAFRRHYETVHLPLARRLPGLVRSYHSFEVASVDGSPGCFCVWCGEFEDVAAMARAMQSPEGQALAADVPNYASGGLQLMHHPVTVDVVEG